MAAREGWARASDFSHRPPCLATQSCSDRHPQMSEDFQAFPRLPRFVYESPKVVCVFSHEGHGWCDAAANCQLDRIENHLEDKYLGVS